MPSLGVLWRTVRHLKPRQIRYQVRYQLARRLGIPFKGRPLPMQWRALTPKLAREKNTDRVYLGEGAFTFNNETRPFTGDWNDSGARKLWLYNLHYMGWLFDINGEGALEARERWIMRWAQDNPPASGNGWEPYPLSLRIFNWCKHYTVAQATPPADVHSLLEVQAGHLLANLEFHLDANHLLENLLALTYAGFHLDPKSPRSRKALARIGRLVEEELDAQFLEDGGHYELSPMYHAILLERLLDLLNVWPESDDPFPGLHKKLHTLAKKALDWLDVMSVGGKFSLFNDACYDAAPDAGMLLDFGSQLLGWQCAPRAALRALPASGYYRAEAGPFTLIFDAGKLGPDHQMGHAQGDLLSFCLWVHDIPVIVHPGNYEYVAGEMRDYCRSTAAHNTLVIDGAEQAEWWGSHRVGRRARPTKAGGVAAGDGAVRLWGEHNGYSHLPGKPIHYRELELTESTLRIWDVLSKKSGSPMRIHFHIHPDSLFEMRRESLGRIVGTGPGMLRFLATEPLRAEAASFCPEFGVKIQNQVVIAEVLGNSCFVTIKFEGLRLPI